MTTAEREAARAERRDVIESNKAWARHGRGRDGAPRVAPGSSPPAGRPPRVTTNPAPHPRLVEALVDLIYPGTLAYAAAGVPRAEPGRRPN